jgi:hypothetical protein
MFVSCTRIIIAVAKPTMPTLFIKFNWAFSGTFLSKITETSLLEKCSERC